MIYPISVHKQAQSKGRVSSSDLMQFGTFLFVIFIIAVFFFTDWLLKAYFGIGVWASILVTLLVAIVLGTVLFRYLIFNEPEKIQEYENQSTDSFSKYVYVRKDVINSIEIGGNKVQCFEYVNGTNLCVLQFRYGSNDENKSKNTLHMFEQIFSLLGEEGIAFRTVNMTEDFEDSAEFDNVVKQRNLVRDKQLRYHLLKVADNLFKETKEHSNTVTMYLMLCTNPNYSIDDLESALRRIFILLQRQPLAFRSVNFLDRQGLLKLFRDFYGLETIDLSTMRVIELSQELNEQFDRVVSLYKIKTDSGKVFVNEDALQGKFHTATKECSGN